MKRVLFVILLIFVVGCGSEAVVPVVTDTAVPIATDTATVAAAAVVEPATATALPTATEAPTATATATNTATTVPSPTATAVLATETATLVATVATTAVDETTATEEGTATPASETSTDGESTTATEAAPTTAPPPPATGGVTQPPYQASNCSDKYPCNDDVAGWEARIRVPAGFQATYFARIPNMSPTSMTFGPDGQLYVAVQQGTIYKVDGSGNFSVYTGGFVAPTGIAFRPGTNDLYVASRVLDQNVDGEAQISIVNRGQIIGGLPCCYTSYHAANGIAFGPDGFGYVSVGGRADHGEILVGANAGQQDERHPLEASILRFSPDGSQVEAYARGFRNAYDIAWDGNGSLFATDNMPDFFPPEELHRVVPGGEHGYPWYDCDVCFAAPADVQIVPPIYQFVPRAAPTGITAYLADQFPGYYNSLFVTLWSSFPGAQKVMRFGPGGVGASDFATGFAAPIDVTTGPDGSLYVADWATGIIFKISYVG